MNKKKLQKIILISLINYFLILAVSLTFSIIILGVFSVVLIIMTILSTFLLVYHWYFTSKPKFPIKEGLIVGLILALITFFIEFSLWIFIFGWIYFLNLTVLLQYILIIFVPIFAAILKQEEKLPIDEKESTWKDRLR